MTNTYWDSNVSGTITAGTTSATAVTTAQLQSALPTGFSAGIWGIIADDGTNPNGSYPYLLAFNSSVPRVISGFIPNAPTSSIGLNGQTIQLAYNGSNISTVTTGNDGFYYFQLTNGTLPDSSAFLVYLNNATEKANAVVSAPTSGGSVTLLDLANNTLQVGVTNSGTLSNTLLGTAKGSLSSTDILYSVSSGNLTLGNATNSTVQFATSSTTTYNIDGNISYTSGGVGNITFAGPINLTANSTVTAGSNGSNTFASTINGGFGLTLSAAGGNTLSGVVGGSTPLTSLTLSGGGTDSINGNITTSGNQVYNDVIALGSSAITFSSSGGNITLGGALSWSGSNTLALAASAGNINLNSSITATSGTLQLTAQNATSSITPNSSAAINLANFILSQGQWYQVGSGSLPTFAISTHFSIVSGAQFIRAINGAGTSLSPYQLIDIFGVQGIGSTSTTLADYYQLNNAINAAVTSNWTNGFVPIGSSTTPFTGTFNGQNSQIDSISNVVINNSGTNVGFFGYANNATISNMGLTNLTITGSGTNVGGLVGQVAGSTTLTSSYTSGSVAGNTVVGGLVGLNAGSISNAYSTATGIHRTAVRTD